MTPAMPWNLAAQQWLRGAKTQGLVGPILIVMILAMMVLPLPAFLLDLLFTFNIALSLVVVMAVFYVLRPLEFGVFPTVLLLATLPVEPFSVIDLSVPTPTADVPPRVVPPA